MVRSADSIRVDYLNLLTTQLQNQNPLEPMSNNEMAAQLASFSQLEQLEAMNTSFEEVLQKTQLSYASNLIGQGVTFTDMNQFNEQGEQGVDVAGVVERVKIEADQIVLEVGEYDPQSGGRLRTHEVSLDNLKSIGFDISGVSG